MKRTNEASPNAAADGKTFSEDELKNRAANVDASLQQNHAGDPLQMAMAGEPPAAGAAAGAAATDPMMASTLKVLVDFAVKRLRESWYWTDPGDDWKTAVSQLSARIIDKYMPSIAEQQSEEIALLIILSPWILENTLGRRAEESDSDVKERGNNVESNVEEVKLPTFPPTPKEANPIYEVAPA